MKYRIVLATLLFMVLQYLYSDSQVHSVLSGDLLVFGDVNSSPIRLESQRGWTTVGTIDWSSHAVESAPNIIIRRWRMQSKYAHKTTAGPATVQVRIRSQNGSSVFTHPWVQNTNGSDASYSNWFEDPNRIVDSSDWSIIEARLISPPQHPLSGTLYSLSLEAWDDIMPRPVPAGATSDAVQLAYADPMSIKNIDAEEIPVNRDSVTALNFALRFVSYCLEGNVAAYYRSMNDQIHSMQDGTIQYKYSLLPPNRMSTIPNIKAYTEQFEYTVHGVDAMREFYPEWFDESREWIPGPNSYLFMGHQTNSESVDLSAVDFLIFIVEPNAMGKWKVVARPEN